MSARGTSDLLFLLSMSGLAAGCSKGVTNMGAAPFGPSPGSASNGDDSDDETGDDDREEGSSSGAESDPILTSGPDNTSDASITTDPGSTSGLPETTTGVSGPEPTSGPPGESSSGPVGTSGGPMPTGEPCADYGEWAANCYGVNDGEEFCYYLISYYGAYYGPACASAFEEMFACVSTQPCGAVGCAAEQNAVNSAC